MSFEILDTEIFALLGPNGAGKTTTMRMLSTLLSPTGGIIRYDKEPIRGREREIKRKIAFLTNEIRLDGQFSPNQSAAFYGRLYGLTAEQLRKNKQELFDYFGITAFADRKYETFSTGMKQKTAIAVCLLHDPEIVIFDEPTNGLDVLTQRLVENYILELKKRGKCVIISTHLLDVVERLSDRVGVIIDGRSVFCGTCEEMVQKEGTRDLSEAFVSLYEKHHQEEPPTSERPPRIRHRSRHSRCSMFWAMPNTHRGAMKSAGLSKPGQKRRRSWKRTERYSRWMLFWGFMSRGQRSTTMEVMRFHSRSGSFAAGSCSRMHFLTLRQRMP